MKIVFIGASKFGLCCLDLARTQAACQVVGVVTAPAKFPISYRPAGVTNVLHADVTSYCDEYQIPYVVMTEGMKSPALMSHIQAWQPDIFLVVGWYHMVPKTWRDIAPAYGLHASLLPDYSGGAPLVWAIINGEEKTGITLFQLADGVDSGAVIGQTATLIDEDDTIATLYERIEGLGLGLLKNYLPALTAGTAPHQIQDESRRRIFPQRGPEDGEIRWSQDVRSIFNFVRAQTKPYPGAFTTWHGDQLTIWKSRPVLDTNKSTALPGQIKPLGTTMLVQTGNGMLEIIEASYKGQDVDGAQLCSILDTDGILGDAGKIQSNSTN